MAEIRSQIGPNSLWQRPTPTTGTGVSVLLIEAAYLRHFTREIKLLSTICSNPENKRSSSPESSEIRYVTFYTTEIRAYSKPSKSKEKLLSISKGFGSGLKMQTSLCIRTLLHNALPNKTIFRFNGNSVDHTGTLWMKTKVSRVWLPPPHSCKHPDKHCLENNMLLPNVIKTPTHVLCVLKQNLRVFCCILPHQLILRISSDV